MDTLNSVKRKKKCVFETLLNLKVRKEGAKKNTEKKNAKVVEQKALSRVEAHSCVLRIVAVD